MIRGWHEVSSLPGAWRISNHISKEVDNHREGLYLLLAKEPSTLVRVEREKHSVRPIREIAIARGIGSVSHSAGKSYKRASVFRHFGRGCSNRNRCEEAMLTIRDYGRGIP